MASLPLTETRLQIYIANADYVIVLFHLHCAVSTEQKQGQGIGMVLQNLKHSTEISLFGKGPGPLSMLRVPAQQCENKGKNPLWIESVIFQTNKYKSFKFS